MTLAARYAIAPQMEDYDRLGARWLPYLMRFNEPSARFASVSTDPHGFRTTTGNDSERAISLEHFVDPSRDAPRGILLGGSAAFGVGATHDRYTIPSVLNRITNVLWFNFGGRACNSTQEMLLFVLYLPRRLQRLVVFSGLNNLTLSYLAPSTSAVYNSLFYQSVFERAMEAPPDPIIGVRRSLRLLGREIWRKVRPQSSSLAKQVHADIETQYSDILKCFERDLEVLRLLGDALGFQICFAFQPIATWIDKVLSREEQQIFAVLDRMQVDWTVLATYISDKRDRYIADVHGICTQKGIPFCDLNAFEAFAVNEWLFVDRVHLTDRGHAVAAEILKGVFGL